MKYEKCLSCDQLGTNCDGPNLLLLDTVELGHWMNELRNQRPGMTYDKTAMEAAVAKTTIYNFLNGKHSDCKMETVRSMAKLFIGGNCDDNPCGNVTNSEKAVYEERIRQLEADIRWREDKIQHLNKQVESMQTLITNTNKRHDETKKGHEEELAFLRKEIKRKNKFTTAFATIAIVALLVIIAALIVDYLDRSIGFLWLESLVKPHGINEIIQQWRT